LKQVTVRGEKVWKVNEDCKLNPAYAHRVLPALIESAQDLKDVEHIPELEKEMLKAAKAQDYVRAATIKKRIDELNGKGNGLFDL
jgi:excinuclease UvrABC helicase subunit UvrB